MALFSLRTPVEAVQYARNANEGEVCALIRSSGRNGFSWSNARGVLHVYNEGPELQIADGEWVVSIGGTVAVVSAIGFEDHFEPYLPAN